MAGPARGKVTIDVEECKGCGLCVESCPPKCLELAPELNPYGVHPARYTGHDCTGCGICFYCCPEPGAITVYRLVPAAQSAVVRSRRRTCGSSVKATSPSSKAPVLAGCRAYYGYPITPASEIAEAAALYLPQVGGTFVQAESEVAAINMVYGAAAAGVRVMTASSGPGLSLMQEGISYLAGAELPCVIVDVMRGGPGLGNIAPEQSDYFAMVKGGGHGNYRNLVLAPASVQEMADLTMLAFELADKYRNPGHRPGRWFRRPDDGAARPRIPRNRRSRETLGGEGNCRDSQEPGQLDLPRARRSGRAPAPHGSEVHPRAEG